MTSFILNRNIQNGKKLVIEDHKNLIQKTEKLGQFISGDPEFKSLFGHWTTTNPEFRKLSPLEQALLTDQLKTMQEYIVVLKKRIDLF